MPQARDAFSTLFMTRLSFLRHYDFYVEAPLVAADWSLAPQLGPDSRIREDAELCDRTMDAYLSRRVAFLLTKALGDRATHVRAVCRPGTCCGGLGYHASTRWPSAGVDLLLALVLCAGSAAFGGDAAARVGAE
jgi:hypothetical protein